MVAVSLKKKKKEKEKEAARIIKTLNYKIWRASVAEIRCMKDVFVIDYSSMESVTVRHLGSLYTGEETLLTKDL